MSEHLTLRTEECDMPNADVKGEVSLTHRDLDEENIASPARIKEKKHQADSSPEYVNAVSGCLNIPQSPSESPFMIGQIWKTYCNTLQSPSSLQQSHSLQSELMSVGYESVIPSVQDDTIKDELIDYSLHTSHLNESNSNIETYCKKYYNPSMTPCEANNSQSTENELPNKTEIKLADKILSGNDLLDQLNIITKNNETPVNCETEPLECKYQGGEIGDNGLFKEPKLNSLEEISQLRENNKSMGENELHECIIGLKATDATQCQNILQDNSDLAESVGVELNVIIHPTKISIESIEMLKENELLEKNVKRVTTSEDQIEEPKLDKDKVGNENFDNASFHVNSLYEDMNSTNAENTLYKPNQSSARAENDKLDDNTLNVEIDSIILPHQLDNSRVKIKKYDKDNKSFTQIDENKLVSNAVEHAIVDLYPKESKLDELEVEIVVVNSESVIKNDMITNTLTCRSNDSIEVNKVDDEDTFGEGDIVPLNKNEVNRNSCNINLDDSSFNGNISLPISQKEELYESRNAPEDIDEKSVNLKEFEKESNEINKTEEVFEENKNLFETMPLFEEDLGHTSVINAIEETESDSSLHECKSVENKIHSDAIEGTEFESSLHKQKSLGKEFKFDSLFVDCKLDEKSETFRSNGSFEMNNVDDEDKTFQSNGSFGIINKVDDEDIFGEVGHIVPLNKHEVNKNTCNIDLDDNSFVGNISLSIAQNTELDKNRNTPGKVEKTVNLKKVEKESNEKNKTEELFEENKNLFETMPLFKQDLGHTSVINAIEETDYDSSLHECKSVENKIHSDAIVETEFESSLHKRKSLGKEIKFDSLFVDCKLDEKTETFRSNGSSEMNDVDDEDITFQSNRSFGINKVEDKDIFGEVGHIVPLNEHEVNKNTCNIDLDDNSFVGNISLSIAQNTELDQNRNTPDKLEKTVNLKKFESESNEKNKTEELFEESKNLFETMSLFQQDLGHTSVINAIEETESDSSLHKSKSVENKINSDAIEETEFESCLHKRKSLETEIKCDTSFVDYTLDEKTIKTCRFNESIEVSKVDNEDTFGEGRRIVPLNKQDVSRNTCNIDLDDNSFVEYLSLPIALKKGLDETRNPPDKVEKTVNLKRFDNESNETNKTEDLSEGNKNLFETMPLFKQDLGHPSVINAIEETKSDSSLHECKTVENKINSDAIEDTEFESCLHKRKSLEKNIKPDTSFFDYTLDEKTLTCRSNDSIEVDDEDTFVEGGRIVPLNKQEASRNTCNINLDDSSFNENISLSIAQKKDLHENRNPPEKVEKSVNLKEFEKESYEKNKTEELFEENKNLFETMPLFEQDLGNTSIINDFDATSLHQRKSESKIKSDSIEETEFDLMVHKQESLEKKIKSDTTFVDCKLDENTIEICQSFEVNKVDDEYVFIDDEASSISINNSKLQDNLIKPETSFTILKGNIRVTHSVTEEQVSFIDVNNFEVNSCKIESFGNRSSLQKNLNPIEAQTNSIPIDDNTLDENTDLGVSKCSNSSSEESYHLQDSSETGFVCYVNESFTKCNLKTDTSSSQNQAKKKSVIMDMDCQQQLLGGKDEVDNLLNNSCLSLKSSPEKYQHFGHVIGVDNLTCTDMSLSNNSINAVIIDDNSLGSFSHITSQITQLETITMSENYSLSNPVVKDLVICDKEDCDNSAKFANDYYEVVKKVENVQKVDEKILNAALNDVQGSGYLISSQTMWDCSTSNTDDVRVNVSHEMMQKSMSDHVTSQSLKLSIPQEDNLLEEYCVDEELRLQCELQTENVLLMKWPAEFHKKLSDLKEQNDILSDKLKSTSNNDIHLSSLRKENDELHVKLEKISKRSEDVDKENITLIQKLKLLNEDQKRISDLKAENVKLLNNLERYSELENDLTKFKAENKHLLETIAFNTAEKGVELPMLTSTLEKERQIISSENGKFLNSKEKIQQSSSVDDIGLQLKNLIREKSNLQENVQDLKTRLDEINRLNEENLINLMKFKEKSITSEELTRSLENEVLNLKTQNELLWNELKKSTKNEEGLYVVEEEKLVLEKRMSQMKKQLQELDEIKLVNEKLKFDLVNKGTDIYKLSDDKKKLKSSLIKANAKLIELENENECLSELVEDLNSKIDELESQTKISTTSVNNLKEEKQMLQVQIEELIKKEEEHKYSVESEQINFQTNLCSLSEYISSLITENNFIREQLVLHEIQAQKCEEEKYSLKIKLKSEHELTETISTQNNQLKSQIYQLKEITDMLMKDLEIYKNMCIDLDDLKEQNAQLNIKISSLLETIHCNEENDYAVMEGISNLSESVSSFWEENVLLKKQVIMSNKERENLMSKYSSEKKELLEQVSILQKQCTMVEQKNVYLTGELNDAEHNEILIRDLENHISSLNEEFMSEIAKYDSLSLVNARIEGQLNSILDEQQRSEKELSVRGREICDLENLLKKSKEDLELKNIEIMKAEQNLTLVEKQNDMLAAEVNNLQSLLTVVQELEDNIAFLNNKVNSKNIELNELNTQLKTLEMSKMEAESKTEVVNQLLNKQEEVVNELNLRLKHDHELLAEAKLELQIKNKEITHLTEIIECKTKENNDFVNIIDKLDNDCKEVDIYAKENSDLRKIMVKEISSLTDHVETNYYDTCPITNVFQVLMTEFLSKEKEVILGLQSDYETKLKKTADEIDKLKKTLETKQNYLEEHEKEMIECRKQFDEQIITISKLENSHKITISELQRKEHDIEELQKQLSQISIEKDTLIQSNDLKSNNIFDLEQKAHLLESDLVLKDGNILSLNEEIKQLLQCISEFETRSEIHSETLNHNKNVIELMTEISELNLKLPRLEHELSLKTSEVLSLKNELEHLRISQSELIEQMSEQQTDLENLTDKLHDHKNMLCELNIDLQNKNKELLEINKYVEIIGQENKEFKLRIEKLNFANDECYTLETQIKHLNEELKANKLLYEEDLFKYKEEISTNTSIIKDLNAIIGKQQSKTVIDNNKKDQEIILKLQEELQKFKKENATLSEGYNKFNIINRNLSLEIEQLSIALKHEKETNADLTAKYNSTTNHIAEYKKQNYCLKDKIDELESKIQNQCLLSSLKIVFPYGVDTIDKQLAFINDKFAEFDKLKSKMDNLSQENKTMSTYITSQEEKMSTILKRELNLKKFIPSSAQQTFDQNKVLEQLESELLPLFDEKIASILDVPAKVRALKEANELLSCSQLEDIKELGRKLDEAIQENKDLDSECEMMHKHIKEQEEMLATVLKREEELKKINMELASHTANSPEGHKETSSAVLIDGIERLYEVFPDRPATFNEVLSLIKNTQAEVESLKYQISESKDECRNLDKECEDMFNQYQEKEKELAEVLRREAKFASDTNTINENLKETIKMLTTELEGYKSQTKSTLSSQAECHCTELKSRLSELKLDLADRNAKITALELQLEANSFPMKKKVTDLEKSLDQAKLKINELKAEVRRNQHQMEEVTVALRADCERCRVQPPTAAHHDSGVQTTPTHTADELSKKVSENNKLKALCKSRNIRIAQLEQALGEKLPRTHRTPLKEMKDNFNTSSS